MTDKSKAEEQYMFHVTAAGLPEPEREYRFHPVRKWRFDFAWPDRMLGVEIEGGIYTRGRHVRPDGFKKDIEKYNSAALLGWMMLRFTSDQVDNGWALEITEQALETRGAITKTADSGNTDDRYYRKDE